jgi:uncharacterized membrane protein YgcG
MNSCAQRTGFLTLTLCGEPAVAICVECGKPICGAHLAGDPSHPLCPDCAVQGLNEDEASRRGLDSSYYRNSLSAESGMMAYSSSDYGSFDAYEGGGGEMGGGGAGGDWGGSGDDGGTDEGSAADFQDS